MRQPSSTMPLRGNRAVSVVPEGGWNAWAGGEGTDTRTMVGLAGGRKPPPDVRPCRGRRVADRCSLGTSSAGGRPRQPRLPPTREAPRGPWPQGMAYSRQKHRFFVCQYHVSEDGEAPPQDFFQPADFVAALKVSTSGKRRNQSHRKRPRRTFRCGPV